MMREWWRSIEEQLDARSESAPDPWSDRCDAAVDLTAEQQQFLSSVHDQPDVIRMHGAALGLDPEIAEPAEVVTADPDSPSAPTLAV